MWKIISLSLILAVSSVALVKSWGEPGNFDLGGLERSADTAGEKNKMEFGDSFEKKRVIEEAPNMQESKERGWWLNSGAYFVVENGVGRTVYGKLSEGEKWQKKYFDYNVADTDGGYRPQNIFRLVTRGKWKNFTQEVWFRVNQYNLSESAYRKASNGVLLFNRYVDGDNLYYTGLRVDGAAVIKKKLKGEYYTMAYEQVFKGKYDRDKSPNLLPVNEWIGIRSEVFDDEGGVVRIKLYMKRGEEEWKLVAQTEDKGGQYGVKIADPAHAGLRSDFMDVEFDDYWIGERSQGLIN